MPSVTVLRVVVGAALGLGGADLAVINLVLAPGLVPDAEPLHVATAAPPAPRSSKSAPVVPPNAAPRTVAVYFASDRAVLSDAGRDAIGALVPGDGTISLVGHADISGLETHNRTLSRQRADAVAAELIARGVARSRIAITYRGSDAASAAGPLWRDRRVDIDTGGQP